MIEFTPAIADHIVSIRVDGKVEKADIERIMKAIEEKLLSHDQVSFFVEIDDVSGITAEAFLTDVRYGIDQLKNLGRFRRAAVVTDIKWIRAAAGLEDLLIPKVEVKAFSKDDRDVAVTWVAKLTTTPSKST